MIRSTCDFDPLRVTLFSVLFALGCLFPVGLAAQGLEIADANLEAALRRSLGKPTGALTQSDLESLKTLSAVESGIENISGLEFAVNLSELHLWGNKIHDLRPLSGLSQLRTLYLSDNRITDLDPLAGLTGLDWLVLSGNQVDDLGPLVDLKALRSLDLARNRIVEVGELAKLENLNQVWLAGNRIVDISGLVGSPSKLSLLDISNNEIRDASSLVGLSRLETLYAYNNYLDIGPESPFLHFVDGLECDVEFAPQLAWPSDHEGESPINISMRGYVGRGSASLIAGFTNSRSDPIAFLIRGVGPALKDFGVASPLPNPVIHVHRMISGGAPMLVAENDDWNGPYEDVNAYRAVLVSSENVGAFPLESSSRESALYLHLDPGTYTVTLSGSGGGEGVGLIEIYQAN